MIRTKEYPDGYKGFFIPAAPLDGNRYDCSVQDGCFPKMNCQAVRCHDCVASQGNGMVKEYLARMEILKGNVRKEVEAGERAIDLVYSIFSAGGSLIKELPVKLVKGDAIYRVTESNVRFTLGKSYVVYDVDENDGWIQVVGDCSGHPYTTKASNFRKLHYGFDLDKEATRMAKILKPRRTNAEISAELKPLHDAMFAPLKAGDPIEYIGVTNFHFTKGRKYEVVGIPELNDGTFITVVNDHAVSYSTKESYFKKLPVEPTQPMPAQEIAMLPRGTAFVFNDHDTHYNPMISTTCGDEDLVMIDLIPIDRFRGYRLPNETEIRKFEVCADKPNLAGLIVCITGTLKGIGRKEAKELLEKAGAHVTGSVTEKTDLLIAGETAGSKFIKAESLGIKIVNSDFFNSIRYYFN